MILKNLLVGGERLFKMKQRKLKTELFGRYQKTVTQHVAEVEVELRIFKNYLVFNLVLDSYELFDGFVSVPEFHNCFSVPTLGTNVVVNPKLQALVLLKALNDVRGGVVDFPSIEKFAHEKILCTSLLEKSTFHQTVSLKLSNEEDVVLDGCVAQVGF